MSLKDGNKVFQICDDQRFQIPEELKWCGREPHLLGLVKSAPRWFLPYALSKRFEETQIPEPLPQN